MTSLALAQSIENLYQVFAKYPLDKNMGYSPALELETQNQILINTPLQDLTCKDLGLYSAKAVWTWGNEIDLKHFLPQILALWAKCGSVEIDESSLIDKFERLALNTTEKQALAKFFEAIWLRELNLSTHFQEDIVRAIVSLTGSFDSIIERWETLLKADYFGKAFQVYLDFMRFYYGAYLDLDIEFEGKIIAYQPLIIWANRHANLLEDAFFSGQCEEYEAEIEHALTIYEFYCPKSYK